MNASRSKGFTLIELIIVLAILAIVIAILYPIGQRSIEIARKTQCMGNLHQWGMMWQAYTADNDGRFTPGIVNVWEDEDGIFQGNKNNHGWARGEWCKALLPYIGDKTELLVCPEATKPLPNPNGGTWAWGTHQNTYRQGNWPNHPSSPSHLIGQPVARDSSYGFNCWMFDPPFWVDGNGNRSPDPGEEVTNVQGRPADQHFRRITAISDDVHWIPIILDSMWRGGGPDDDPSQAFRYQTPAFNGEWITYNREMMHFAMDRHQGGVNAIFADMSVRHVPVKQLWRLKWHRDFNVALRDSISWPGWIDRLEDQWPPGFELN